MGLLKNTVFGRSKEIVRVFRSTWNTSLVSTGSSTDTQIKLPLHVSGVFDFVVDWGDGSSSTITAYNQAEATHTYSVAGIYDLKIRGYIKGWTFANSGDRLKLLSITEWGVLQLGLENAYFYGCANLTLDTVVDAVAFEVNQNLRNAFNGCTSLVTINRSNEWDTSKVTDLNACFYGCTKFNSDISTWDVGLVTDLTNVFYNCSAFDSDLSNWDVSNVIGLSYAFRSCVNFKSDLSSWNTVKVNSLNNTFYGCALFNSNLSAWDTSKVINMAGAFNRCSIFNNGGSPGINNWNTSAVTTMANMFYNCAKFNQPIGNWDVSKVTTWYASSTGFLHNAADFNQDLGNWQPLAANTMTNFLAGKTPATYSAAYIDSIYNKWSLLTLKTGVTLSFSTAKYTAAGSTGRANLVSKGWTLIDGGI